MQIKRKIVMAILGLSLGMPLAYAGPVAAKKEAAAKTTAPTASEVAARKLELRKKVAEQISKDVPAPAKQKA